MKDNKVIHPLAQPSVPSGKIKVIHIGDGKEHTFYSCKNSMTGDRMTWWDSQAPEIGWTLGEVRRMFKAIREKSPKVLEVVGDF